MNLPVLLDMAADGFGERVALGPKEGGLTYAALRERARRTARWVSEQGVHRVGVVCSNSEVVPILLFGSGLAGVPFVPISYRLADEQLRAVLARTAPSVVVVDDAQLARIGPVEGVTLVTATEFSGALDHEDHDGAFDGNADPDGIAVLLFTSGTTGEPKAAVLRHRHLASYVIETVEFMGADDGEAALVSVPPYHIAGISAVLTSIYAGRRVVYLSEFTPEAWVVAARDEQITQAMVVPTMLGRVIEALERGSERLEQLRHLSYGGGRMPLPLIERALALLPHVDFVNAYGLTETSSTIAVLGPEDHRLAFSADDPKRHRRLSSVGRPLPTVEVEVRDGDGRRVETSGLGEVWVRGGQVSGEYLGSPAAAADDWFRTRDSGFIDEDGYLYLAGRLDDVIVRGGENLSPGEIEDALVSHPAVAEAGVVGVPDPDWGETVVAAVVLTEGSVITEGALRDWVRSRLRSSKTPEHIEFRKTLPYNDLGKLLRRVLRAELATVDDADEGDRACTRAG